MIQTLTADDFSLVAYQGVVFTPDDEVFPSRKIREEFLPQWTSLLDADPVVLPNVREMPGPVPRFILQDQRSEWRLEIAPARLAVSWRKPDLASGPPANEQLVSQVVKLLSSYKSLIASRIGRLAVLATRYARHQTPGLFLARHFCKTSWDSQPLNRPENFELHAHKRFELAGGFRVNSWARNKVGALTVKTSETPVVLFEQDINTLPEDSEKVDFSVRDIGEFYAKATAELDHILTLYFPSLAGTSGHE